MHGAIRHRALKAWVAVMALCFAIFSLSVMTTFLVLGILATFFVVWAKGFLRFPRLRRVLRESWASLARVARTRRMSRRNVRNLTIVLAAIILLLVLNQFRLSAPGKGHGLSVPVEAFTLNFGGISSPGAWIATSVSYALILGLLTMVWLRFWEGVPRGDWRAKTFLACLLAFVLAPAVFALLLATAAPDDPKANVEFSKLWLRVTLLVMTVAFSTAPLLGDRPRASSPQASPPLGTPSG